MLSRNVDLLVLVDSGRAESVMSGRALRWARPVGPDTACVQNVAFLQDGVAEGDTFASASTPITVFWSCGSPPRTPCTSTAGSTHVRR